MFDLEARTSSLSAYRDLLARLYGFHAGWEPHVAVILADPKFFQRRRKVELLERDLGFLGITRAEIDRLPLCDPIVPMRTPAEALGSMYVMEGSTLGGIIIARQVERSLGLGRRNGCRYFRCYGDDTGPMWTNFRAELLARCGPDDEGVVIATAQRTFEVLGSWLTRA